MSGTSGLRKHGHTTDGDGGTISTAANLLSGNDSQFTASVGNWTNSGGTLSRDTTAAYRVAGFAASLKYISSSTAHYAQVALSGTFTAGKRYDALVWLRVEETSGLFGNALTVALGLQGTDIASTAYSLSDILSIRGTSGAYAPILVSWVPSADRTGVTLRLSRSTGTATVTAHVGFALVAAVATTDAEGLGIVKNPVTTGLIDDVYLAPGKLWLNGGATLSGSSTNGSAALGSQDTTAQLETDNDGAVYVTAKHPSAGDLVATGLGIEVGPDLVGLYISEKDASTIQIYDDSGGSYHIELVDQGGFHWRSVGAGQTRNLNDELGRTVVHLTNKSGGSVVAGDVVKIDTSNNEAFTTTTTGQAEVSIGIAQATIANNATGMVLVAGYAPLVNVPASVTRGHYLETHTVAKQATGNGTRRAGSFGQFLTGGATPVAWLWGQTDQTASGGGASVATDTIFDAKGDLPVGTGADTAAKLAVGANDTTLMADSAQSTGVKWLAVGALTEAALSGDVTMTTANTFYDGPTSTPAAGVYDVVARLTFTANAANVVFEGRLIANGSATPIDEAEVSVATNTHVGSLVLTARVTADGTNPILIRITASNNGCVLKRDPLLNSSGVHRATLLRLTRVS